jgi:gliding motility-associated-like protein
MDENGCHYDTSFTIQPYPRDAVTLSIDTVNPICTTLNSGSLTITVQGDQAPYWLSWASATYSSGSTIANLSRGDFVLPVINKDGCVVDSAHAHLDLDIEPACEMVYIPNAFTPNGNGTNDLFRVIHSPYLQITGFRVFNRYGGLLFAGNDRQTGWDGTFHGEPQPAGTYVWEVSYIDLENMAKTAHGAVLLIR